MPFARRPELAILLTVVIWGLNFPLIKLPLESLPPFVVNALRFSVSVVVLGGMHVASRGGFWQPLKLFPGRIVLLGLLGFVVYQLCFILAVDRTTAGSAALLMASSPVWTALGSRVAGLERLSLGAWVGLGVCTAGTVLVVLSGASDVDLSSRAFSGNVLALVGAVLWAAYTVLSRPLMDRGVSASGLAFFGMVTALPILFGLGAWSWPEASWGTMRAVDWAALAFSGGLSTGAAYAWWNLGVRRIGPAQTAAWGNLVPVIAVVVGAVLLGEQITAWQAAGGGLILGGLYLMRRARLRAARPPIVTETGPA
jgi:drug/metabolite transporter (DMT)-like permease